MFVAQRTPPKPASKEEKIEKAGPSVDTGKRIETVRRSIGEIEARTSRTPPLSQTFTVSQKAPDAKKRTRPAQTSSESRSASQGSEMSGLSEAIEKSPKLAATYKNKTAEAKAWLLKAKMKLGDSHNLRSDIKVAVTEAVERLYALVKELEGAKTAGKGPKDLEEKSSDESPRPIPAVDCLSRQMEEHGRLLLEHKKGMEQLTELIKTQHTLCESRMTYASVTAGTPHRPSPDTAALHSIVITSNDEQETGEQVFQKIREVVNATEEGVRIDRIRKGKDRKIILGCKSKEEIKKVTAKLKENGGKLNVEEIKNKDPLVILYGVLQSHTDEEIVKAVRNQNRHLLGDVRGEEDRIEVRYRRRARNPLTAHIVLRVSPLIWQRFTEAGAVHIDVQRVKIADQSPLIQCSRCLGYGHGKRFCQDAVDLCSHCGGEHMKTQCPDWLADAPPTCTNCHKAKMDKAEHNAFSSDCPVRRKWEALARSTVAYC